MWEAFVAWFQSAAGQRVLTAAVIPAVAILVAGIIAALIGRSAVRSVLARADRDAVAGCVAALVEAARVLADGRVDRGERERIDRLRTEADVRLRLAPAAGAALAADWASLRLDAIDRDGSSPVRQATADAEELRERLVAWAARPRRAKRLFAADVDRLGAERAARRAIAGPEGGPAPEPVAAPPAADPAATPPESEPADSSTEPTADGRMDGRPEPVSARLKNRSREPEGGGPLMPVAHPEGTSAAPSDPPSSTEPVLIQRTRLDSMERASADPRADHARHARPGSVPAVTVPAEADGPPASAPSEPAPMASVPPVEQPAPSGQAQPTPAWLDTYDDEAEVTRDIDLSKTPPPMPASAVRDRTRTGDDIVPRH